MQKILDSFVCSSKTLFQNYGIFLVYRNICKAQKKYAEPRRVVSGYIAITWKPSREVRGSRVHPASHIHPASCGPQPPRTTTSHGEVRGKEKAQKASQFVSVARKKTLSGQRKLNRLHLSVIVWYIANICERKKYAGPNASRRRGGVLAKEKAQKASQLVAVVRKKSFSGLVIV